MWHSGQLKADWGKRAKEENTGTDGYPIQFMGVYYGKEIRISQLHVGYEYAVAGVFDGWRWAANADQALLWAKQDSHTGGSEHGWRQTHKAPDGTISAEHQHQLKQKKRSSGGIDIIGPTIVVLTTIGLMKWASGLAITPANGYMNRQLRAVTFSDPTTLFLAAFTATPSDTGGGTEVSGGSYARVSIACNTSNWNAASSGACTNAVVFTFPTATASWGGLTQHGLYDASTVGNLYDWGDITNSPKTVGIGDVASVAIGAASYGII